MGLDANMQEPGRAPSGGRAEPALRVEELDLRRVVSTLWRSKWVILMLGLAGLGIAMLYLRSTVPLYEARAEVLWEVAKPNIVDIDPVASQASAASDFLLLQSQIKIVTSSRLLGKVVDEMGLAERPFFNPFAVPPEARSPDLMSLGGILTALARLGLDLGAPEPADPPAAKQREITIDALARSIGVSWVENSYVLVLSTSTPDPRLSADLANEIARFYILDQLEKKFEATRAATEWLSERVAELRLELEAAEQTVEDYSAASELISEEALAARARQIKEMRDRRRDLVERRRDLRGDSTVISDLRQAENFAAIADRLRRPDLVDLAGEIADAPDDGVRAAVIARFDRALLQITLGIEQNAKRAEAQIAALGGSIASLEKELEVQSKALVELRQLQREAEASRLIYESFLSRLKETTVQEGIQQPDARMLSDAWVPDWPSKPKKVAILGLGAIAGLVAGVSIIVLREKLNATFRTAGELEARTGQAVLGTIPLAPLPRRQALLDFLAKRPGSSFAESIRNLRTSVLLANIDKPPQVIMVSSGEPGEGKTTTCVALAQISCSLGKSVLIVECDLRRRNFRRVFDIEHERGLLSVLSGRMRYEDVVHVEESSGMHVLPGERSSVNAADVFASKRFAEFLQELRGHYDFIFVDTPPVLAVPDARVIAQHADALVYVVRWNRTLRETVAAGLRTFAQVNARITGVALTQVDMKDMERYGYRDFSYYRTAQRYYQN
ncbi:polysaccharide biosynthesis tyrosine autokinase [Paralimibaculum aggregatum]|uniref:non-specific protein-tyrosine kinase n=1 Tax=Paralimibaculum aggregatum TaxID=3036245 RepID=A0ABQ6LPE0_9RHOB|nr:polysaccharide biosynthesis tyrosine autokinase [Limibaculum sp. NKW23]GMG82326.1 polysaccharide biosynthesis tyrosine autokinase [Limibaculum sp. NKW23]